MVGVALLLEVGGSPPVVAPGEDLFSGGAALVARLSSLEMGVGAVAQDPGAAPLLGWLLG